MQHPSEPPARDVASHDLDPSATRARSHSAPIGWRLPDDGGEPTALRRAAEAQVRLGAYAEAYASFEMAARRHAARGELELALGVYREARTMIERGAPELGDRQPDIDCGIAELLERTGDRRAARAAYLDAATRMNRAGRYLGALDVLRRLVELDPNDPHLRVRLGEALVRQGDAGAAVRALSHAARLYLERGERDDAIGVLERMAYLEPDPVVARRAAELYLSRGGRGDAVRAMARLVNCLEQAPDDDSVLPLVVRALTAAGHVEKAVALERAMWGE